MPVAPRILSEVVAFGGYLLFLVVAFGVRTTRRRRRTGLAGWRRPSSRADLTGEALCTVGCIGTAVAPLMAMLGLVRPAGVAPGVSVGGLALLAVGIGVALRAQTQLGDDWKPAADPTDDSRLVTRGMFNTIRNPFYLGCMLSSVGMAFVVPSVVGIAAAGTVTVAAELVVRFVEEPQLRTAHGPAYRDYVRRTGRFLPRVGRAG